MIEVVSLSASGEVVDIAEAETPEAALLAARTLLDDYAASFPDGYGVDPFSPAARFELDGKVVSVSFSPPPHAVPLVVARATRSGQEVPA